MSCDITIGKSITFKVDHAIGHVLVVTRQSTDVVQYPIPFSEFKTVMDFVSKNIKDEKHYASR